VNLRFELSILIQDSLLVINADSENIHNWQNMIHRRTSHSYKYSPFFARILAFSSHLTSHTKKQKLLQPIKHLSNCSQLSITTGRFQLVWNSTFLYKYPQHSFTSVNLQALSNLSRTQSDPENVSQSSPALLWMRWHGKGCSSKGV